MNVLSLPIELIDGSILPLLGWNDLLRLRRSCKAANNLVKDYVRRHPDKAPEMEIGVVGKGLRAFVAMGIRTRKVKLNNSSGDKFHSAPVSAARFLEDYAPKVTHLHLRKFSLHCTGEGRQFMEGFVNLKSLTVDEVIVRTDEEILLPNVFDQLRELKVTWTNLKNYSHQAVDHVLMTLPKLEHVRISFSMNEIGSGRNDWVFMDLIRTYISVIEQRNNAQRNLCPLKSIDCSELLPPYFDEVDVFHQLCRVCVANNVQLANVEEDWLDDGSFANLPESQRMQLGLPLTSFSCMITDDTDIIRILPMPNLEKLHLPYVGVYYEEDEFGGEQGEEPRCNLPKLKCLSLNMETYEGAISTCRYFFQGSSLCALTELSISDNIWKAAPGEDFVHFLSDCLPAACPNLKKLKLDDLQGTCESLVSLWEGLSALEDISLRYSCDLGDAGFIGSDENNPAFLKLTKLKRLTLGRLDAMTGITDKLFSSVISRMSLTHLFLPCYGEPLISVTSRGIESLLEGPFAASIEKFPFNDWSLQGVSKRAFRYLEKQFRCKDML